MLKWIVLKTNSPKKTELKDYMPYSIQHGRDISSLTFICAIAAAVLASYLRFLYPMRGHQ